MAAGMGPGGCSWLGWAALLPLFVAIRCLPPLRAMLCGALWGLSFYVSAAHLLTTEVAAGLLSLALLVAAPACYALFGAWYTRWYKFDPLGLAVAWMGVELGLLPLSLQQGFLAGTQTGGLLYGLMAHFSGYILVAFVVAYITALLFAVVTRLELRLSWGALRRYALPHITRFGLTEAIRIQNGFYRIALPRAPPF
jgi:hypothetical protein